MAVLKTTSPVTRSGWPSSSPPKRLPSSRSTYPGIAASVIRCVLQDQFLHRFELVGPRSAEQLEEGGLDAGEDRARRLHLLQPDPLVLGASGRDRVLGHLDLGPGPEQVQDRL